MKIQKNKGSFIINNYYENDTNFRANQELYDEITFNLQKIDHELPEIKKNQVFKNIDETNILYDMMKDTLKSSP